LARTIAKDHNEKRSQILKSAAKVFAEQGYDRASMTVLARECGISKANIYHYYDSKDAILFDILDSYLSHLRDRVLGVNLEGLSVQDQLCCVIQEVLSAYQGADHEHQVQVNALSALPQHQQKLLRAYQRDLVGFMSDRLKAVAPDMFDGAPEKLRSVTMSVFGMLNWYYMWNSGAGTQARQDYARLVCSLTLGGLRGLD
jgi:AcrR family transcriptional regulator